MMKKSKLLILCTMMALSVLFATGCGNNHVENDRNTENGTKVGDDLRDAGRNLIDSVEDTGDAIRDGVDDLTNGVNDRNQ